MRSEELLTKYGIERPRCGWTPCEGWSNILDQLISELIKIGWDKDLHQCKEKFGGLRFYVGQTTPEMDTLISKAEREASKVCCACGVEATVTDGCYEFCKSCHELDVANAAEWESRSEALAINYRLRKNAKKE
jgi:hypothetical protein